MISRENLTQEFLKVVKNYYPEVGKILDCCYVKILECYIERSGRRFYYIGIYYPERITAEIQANRDVFKEIAENMGLVEAVCINATPLVRDPMSQLKQENPHLWLELYWVAAH